MPANDYLVFRFPLAEADQEVLLAHLVEWPFNGFMQEPNYLEAYLNHNEATSTLLEELRSLCENLGYDFVQTTLPGQNWNARWEAGFSPVSVNNFVGIRAEFHPPFQGVQHDLLIHPRMAFGTGHHATTWLMMDRMQNLDFKGKKVFDYGCGTGILAILTHRLGAQEIEAVDIEAAATENTYVNMVANGLKPTDIQVYTGDITAVPSTIYDFILANINRNVILASLEALYQRLHPDGNILFSGILQKDQSLVEQRAKEAGFVPVLQTEREGWLMLHYRR